uniref:XRE family transcriptional regulator n=1 Tax=Metapseudomonas otitidis TaxID=319939 RepID=UPI0035A24357
MDIYAIRKQNLIALIGTRRKNACAQKWEMSAAHLSQILSDKTEKNLGDDVARRIETMEGLDRGWLDQLRDTSLVAAEPSNLKDRVKQARTFAGLTQEELAKLVGVSQPVISQLERGENLQSVHLLKIAEVCGVDPIWLSSGQGVAPYVGETDDEPTENVRQKVGSSAADLVQTMLATKAGKALSAEARERLLLAAEDTQPATNVITADFSRRPIRGDEIRIAHYDVRGAMGSGKLVREYPEMLRDVTVSQEHLRELGVKYKDPAHLKMITGDGESMAPTIRHLDPLIVDASIREFTGDGIYAFTWQGLFYIKRLQMRGPDHFRMLSDNTLHPPEDIRVDETYIQARVLLVWNARRV